MSNDVSSYILAIEKLEDDLLDYRKVVWAVARLNPSILLDAIEIIDGKTHLVEAPTDLQDAPESAKAPEDTVTVTLPSKVSSDDILILSKDIPDDKVPEDPLVDKSPKHAGKLGDLATRRVIDLLKASRKMDAINELRNKRHWSVADATRHVNDVEKKWLPERVRKSQEEMDAAARDTAEQILADRGNKIGGNQSTVGAQDG